MECSRVLVGAGWLWRWGTLAVAGLGALAAVAVFAGWVWDPAFQNPDAFGRIVAAPFPWFDQAVAAAAFSLVLLACRAIVGPDAPAVLPASFATGRRTEALLAATAIGTGVVVATLQLDGVFSVDETETLMDFVVNQPFAVAAGRYDQPNNHVFHTILVWVAHQLGGLNRIVVRLPAFLAFCLLLPVLWRFVRDEYGPGAAVFATAFVSVSPHIISYATVARGYTLQFLLFATALVCGQRLVQRPGEQRWWAAWVGALALGLFTIPLMAFPVAVTATWMLLARWRRFGRDGLGSFAARTAAGLAATVVVAGVLYLVATDVREVYTTLSAAREEPVFNLGLHMVISPAVMWHQWHMGVPPWVRGALMALVFVGVAGAGRSCGRRGTLLLATGLATGLLALALGTVPYARLMMWALVVLLILAGVGASLVLERAVVRASARWPGVATARGWRVVQWGALVLVLGALSWWASRPGVRVAHIIPSIRCSTPASWWCLDGVAPAQVPPVATLAVVERLRPGDYFTACYRDRRVAMDMGAVVPVDSYVGEYYVADSSEIAWSVHRVSAEEQAGTNDLFVIESFLEYPYMDMPQCLDDAPPAPMATFLESRWPDHKLVVAFENGRVYALSNWTENP